MTNPKPEMLRCEFLAELVDAPGSGDETVRFRYVPDQTVEIAIPAEWWTALGSPTNVQVTIASDDQTLDVGRYH